MRKYRDSELEETTLIEARRSEEESGKERLTEKLRWAIDQFAIQEAPSEEEEEEKTDYHEPNNGMHFPLLPIRTGRTPGTIFPTQLNYDSCMPRSTDLNPHQPLINVGESTEGQEEAISDDQVCFTCGECKCTSRACVVLGMFGGVLTMSFCLGTGPFGRIG